MEYIKIFPVSETLATYCQETDGEFKRAGYYIHIPGYPAYWAGETHKEALDVAMPETITIRGVA